MPEQRIKTASFNVIKVACIFVMLYFTWENDDGTKSQLSTTQDH